MQLAKVVGTVVATLKDPALETRKLLVIQPVSPSGDATGAALVALDGVGVGVGERVFFVKGREAAFAFLPETVVADASIVGKVDSLDGATLETKGERSEPGREEAARRRRKPRESGRPPRAEPSAAAQREARSGEPRGWGPRGTDSTSEGSEPSGSRQPE